MAIRTTDPAVRALLDKPRASISMTPFIATASALVDWLKTRDTAGILNTTLLELIERWLAAHFYAVRDQQYQQKMVGRSSATFQGQTGMVLLGTYWGQQACLIDVTGILASHAKQAEIGEVPVANANWLGSCDEGCDCDDNDPSALEDE